MFKKLTNCFIFLAFLFVSNTYAQNVTLMKAGEGSEYSLEPNSPLDLANDYLWSIKAVCTILNKDDDNFLAFKIKRKYGSLNGANLYEGDSMTLRLHSKEVLTITAASGARMELLNVGNKTIVTKCTYGFN
jgi:hypothetical protein